MQIIGLIANKNPNYPIGSFFLHLLAFDSSHGPSAFPPGAFPEHGGQGNGGAGGGGGPENGGGGGGVVGDVGEDNVGIVVLLNGFPSFL